MSFVRPVLPDKPIRVPAGWKIHSYRLQDVQPSEVLKIEGYPNTKGWLIFDSELLFFEYEKRNLILDMGWFPQSDPNGEFILRIIKNEKWSEREIICETRDLNEITSVIEDTMLKISLENGDFKVRARNLKLQSLCPEGGWRFVHNQFFELDPQSEMIVEGLPNNDGWQLLNQDLLFLEAYSNEKLKLKLDWIPAHDPKGRYVAQVINEKFTRRPLAEIQTKHKVEVVEFINQMMLTAHKLKLRRIA